MTLKTCFCRCLLTAVLASVVPALASNLGFMRDTPFTHFTNEDHKIFNQTLNDTLNKGADGESRTWSNPKSRAGGEVKALKTFERKGTACRTVYIANTARGRSANAEYNFCKQASGEWGLAN